MSLSRFCWNSRLPWSPCTYDSRSCPYLLWRTPADSRPRLFFKAPWHLGSAFPKCSSLAKCHSWTKRFGLMGGCSKSCSDQEWKEFRKGRKSSTSSCSSLSSSHSGMSSDSWHSRTGELLTSLSLMKETSGSVISDARSLTGLHGAGIKAKADMARVGDWDNETAMGWTKYALLLRKSVIPWCSKLEQSKQSGGVKICRFLMCMITGCLLSNRKY